MPPFVHTCEWPLLTHAFGRTYRVPLSCITSLPVASISITSVAVRGDLGDMTIWATAPHPTPASHRMVPDPDEFTKLYEGTHPSSPQTYAPMTLTTPILIPAGHTIHLYIHSTLPGDTALIYDNYVGKGPSIQNDFLKVDAGIAHVSNEVFSRQKWGWGSAWRGGRCFVGTISYGVTFKLWNPKPGVYDAFGFKFRKGVETLLAMRLRNEAVTKEGRSYFNPWYVCPDDIMFYILNMCHWNWFDDTTKEIEEKAGVKRDKIVQGTRRGANNYGQYEDDMSDEDDDDDDDDDDDYIPPGAPASHSSGTQNAVLQQLLARMPGLAGHPLLSQLLAQAESGFDGQGMEDDEEDEEDEAQFVDADGNLVDKTKVVFVSRQSESESQVDQTLTQSLPG